MIGFLSRRRVALGAMARRASPMDVGAPMGPSQPGPARSAPPPGPDTPIDLDGAMADAEARADAGDGGVIPTDEVRRQLHVDLAGALGSVDPGRWLSMRVTGAPGTRPSSAYMSTMTVPVGTTLSFGRSADQFDVAPVDDPALEGTIWELRWRLHKSYQAGEVTLAVVGPVEPDAALGPAAAMFKTTSRYRVTGQPGGAAEITLAITTTEIPEPALSSGSPVDLVLNEIPI